MPATCSKLRLLLQAVERDAVGHLLLLQHTKKLNKVVSKCGCLEACMAVGWVEG